MTLCNISGHPSYYYHLSRWKFKKTSSHVLVRGIDSLLKIWFQIMGIFAVSNEDSPARRSQKTRRGYSCAPERKLIRWLRNDRSEKVQPLRPYCYEMIIANSYTIQQILLFPEAECLYGKTARRYVHFESPLSSLNCIYLLRPPFLKDLHSQFRWKA